jgi:hypothetical protein
VPERVVLEKRVSAVMARGAAARSGRAVSSDRGREDRIRRSLVCADKRSRSRSSLQSSPSAKAGTRTRHPVRPRGLRPSLAGVRAPSR